MPGELKKLFGAISKTYEHFDEDRSLIERSLELSSKELEEINATLRLEVEKTLFQAQALRKEKAKIEATLASIGDGIVVTEKDGKVLIMNNQAEVMLGWTLSDVRGKMLVDLVPVEDKNGIPLEREKLPLQLAIVSGTKLTTSHYYYTRKDQTKFPVAITASPVILDKEVVGGILVFRDITKETNIDRAKTEFVSLASHQLRTPLSTVKWYVEMLLAGDAGEMNPEQRKYLDTVYAGNQRMVELVNALLNVSRIDLGTFGINPEPTDFVKIMNSVVGDLKPQINQRSLKIQKNYDTNLPSVNADPKLIEIVFQNLLTNAVKYTPPEGTISLGIIKQEDNILIKVSDTGYGIPKFQQSRLFSKLFRGDNIRAKEPEGTGLGLYITKAIVEQSGGKINFESEENKGTTFYVYIPIQGMVKKEGAKGLTS